jgi:hypothetical protein
MRDFVLNGKAAGTEGKQMSVVGFENSSFIRY